MFLRGFSAIKKKQKQKDEHLSSPCLFSFCCSGLTCVQVLSSGSVASGHYRHPGQFNQCNKSTWEFFVFGLLKDLIYESCLKRLAYKYHISLLIVSALLMKNLWWNTPQYISRNRSVMLHVVIQKLIEPASLARNFSHTINACLCL